MRKSVYIIKQLASACFKAAAVQWMFCVFSGGNQLDYMHMNILAVAAFFAVMQFALDFVASKGVNLSVFIILSTLFIVAGTYLFVKTMVLSPNDVDVKSFAALYFIIAAICSSARAWNDVPGSTISRFDTIAALTVVLSVAARFINLPAAGESFKVCVIVLCICLFASMIEKTEQSNALKASSAVGGRIGLGVLFAAFSGIVYAIVSYVGNGAKSVTEAVVWIGKMLFFGVMEVAAFIVGLYIKFMNWLDSLTPDKDPIIAMPEGSSVEMPEEVSEEITFSSPLWFKVLIVVILVVIVVALLYQLRKVKGVARKRISYQTVSVKRQNGLLLGLKSCFGRIKEFVSFTVKNIKYKNTVSGLLIRCEKSVPKEHRRLSKESPQAFLRRLIGVYPDNEEILESLAKLAEIEFYKSEKQQVPVDLAKAVRAIKY